MHSNQIWELTPNGTLLNSYNGLCATVNYIEENVDSNEVRSWIATGRNGEVYMSFFNLSKEVWSGKDVVTTQGVIKMDVEAHGCALFVLNCK
ncbi:alpha-galactosidase 1-like protein [Trifolium pratense]|uniref:Alpha-galactosidase 1-like protein n=1 Tax=Trifolium pratense TaxID=57577 RepID=A0A2K3MGR8_TRIPR|nr:alpha-galactosidase 1-like protein [Trifolium pratense]